MVHFSTQFFNLDEAKPGFLILLINLKTVNLGFEYIKVPQNLLDPGHSQ